MAEKKQSKEDRARRYNWEDGDVVIIKANSSSTPQEEKVATKETEILKALVDKMNGDEEEQPKNEKQAKSG